MQMPDNLLKSMDWLHYFKSSKNMTAKKLDHCVSLFLKALPYMLKAYDLNFRRKDVLEGLVGIYYGLNDDEKYEKYKAELDALKNSEK